MANVNIGDLKWQNRKLPLLDYSVRKGELLSRFVYLPGYKGKITLAGASFTNLLSPSNEICSEPTVNDNLSIIGKDVELDTYPLKLKVPRCELRATYLNDLLSKGASGGQEVYLDNLTDIIATNLEKDIYMTAMGDIISEADSDTAVTKVSLAAITDGTSAYNGIKNFISGVNPIMVEEQYDIESGERYTIFVSTQVMSYLYDYFDDKNESIQGDYVTVDGFRVRSSVMFKGSSMMMVNFHNLALVTDEDENGAISIVSKEEESTDYIVANFSFVGTYFNPARIAMAISV